MKIENSNAVKVHTGEKAKALIAECGRDRLLESRFVITNPDDEQGILKARWCLKGFKDPDLMELVTASPTLSQESLAVTLQVIASKGWRMRIGDVEGGSLPERG